MDIFGIIFVAVIALALLLLLLIGMSPVARPAVLMRVERPPVQRPPAPIPARSSAPSPRGEEDRLFEEAKRQMENEMNTAILKARDAARKRGIG